MTRTGRVQSIDRAVMILGCFSEKNPELKLSDIAEQLGLNKSTAHGIISTLKYHGLMDQNEETQRYRLGPKLMELADIAMNSMDIRSLALPIIDGICQQVEETVHLGTLDKMEVIYIDKKESTQSMRIFTTIGARKPAHCTGIGKVMLAYLEHDLIMELVPEEMERYTPKTITDKSEFIKELAKVKKNGYAIDDEEHDEGLKCIALPIFNHKGKVKYAISVSGPTIRLTDEKILKTIKIMKDGAREISKKLGYSG